MSSHHETHAAEVRAGRRARVCFPLLVALLLVAISSSAALALNSAKFKERGSSPEAVGDAPSAIAAADFNSDDAQDLAVVNGGTGTVSVLINNGFGNFHQPKSSPEAVAAGVHAIAAGDLDHDGDQDLAVAGGSSHTLWVMHNDGSGDFGAPVSGPLVGTAVDIAPVNVNPFQDSDVDLVVANAEGRVPVAWQDSGGVFGIQEDSPVVGGTLTSVAAVDMDDNGVPDVATADANTPDVSIVRNTSPFGNEWRQVNGSPVAAGSDGGYIAAADLDGDGDQDLAKAGSSTGLVTMLLNNGNMKYHEPKNSPEAAGAAATDIVAADLDGDSDQDLAVTDVDNNVAILLNKGEGNFTQRGSSPVAVGDAPAGIAAADMDGDTDLDLATANELSDDVTVLGNK